MGKIKRYINSSFAAWQADSAKRKDIKTEREKERRESEISGLKHKLEVAEIRGQIERKSPKSGGGGFGSVLGQFGEMGANANKNFGNMGGFGGFGESEPKTRRRRRSKPKVRIVYRYRKRRR
jgi:hypothetical protein